MDILQLAAQAMCLEEMFSIAVEKGAIYYGEIRRRQEVLISEELRNQVVKNFADMHQLYEKNYTPKVKWSKSCNGCSLRDLCMPRLGRVSSVKNYIETKMQEGDG
jgi:CRISPR-associated exonuclease Cas4